jgi:hypothetical protein
MIQDIGGDRKEKMDKFVSMLLLTCYNRISEAETNTILKSKVEDINPMSKENLSLLDLETWHRLYESKDKIGIAKKMAEISGAIKDVKVCKYKIYR